MPAGCDLLFQRSGQCGEIRHAERLIRFQEIHPVVRDAAGFFCRHLGRAHVQAAIDLHGVGADDFAGELPGQCHAQRGFSGGRGAYHRKHRVLFLVTRCAQTAFPAPFGST